MSRYARPRHRKPKAPTPKQLEHQHQKRLVGKMGRCGLEYCASVVDCITSMFSGKKARELGYVKGDPDLRIYTPPPAHPECFATALEMKSPDRKPKTGRAHRWSGCPPHQRKRLAMLEARGWHIIVAYGYEDAVSKLSAAGYPMGPRAGMEVGL